MNCPGLIRMNEESEIMDKNKQISLKISREYFSKEDAPAFLCPFISQYGQNTKSRLCK